MSALTVSCFDTLFIAIELTMTAVIISSFSKRRLSLWIAAASLPVLAVIIHVLSALCAGSQIIRACANVVLTESKQGTRRRRCFCICARTPALFFRKRT